jgi:hypothetical protein
MPYLSSTLFMIALVAGALTSIAAFCLLLSAIFPKAVTSAEEAFADRPLRSALLGVPAFVIPTVISVALLNAPLIGARLVGILLSALLAAIFFLGFAGVTRRIGVALAEPEAQPYTRSIRGTAVAFFSMLLPAIGWFVVTPLLIASASGSVLLGFMKRRSPEVIPVSLAKAELQHLPPSGLGYALVSEHTYPSRTDVSYAQPTELSYGRGQ